MSGIDYFAYAVGCVKLASAHLKRSNDMSDKTVPVDDDWFAQGYDAYKAGAHYNDCPYSLSDKAREQWRYGWGAAYSERSHETKISR